MKDSENFRWIKPSDDKREKILKLIEGKTINEKFGLAIENNINWLVEDLIKNGLNINEFEVYSCDAYSYTYNMWFKSVRLRSKNHDFFEIDLNDDKKDFILNIGIKFVIKIMER